MMQRQASYALAVILVAWGLLAPAAVTPEQANRLRADLTPFGAERAGNAEGTIPAWDGGYTSVWPGYFSGQPRPDPFVDEKPRFQITANNMQQYADKLSDGTQALLKQFPDYRLDVYPTRRTAAAPQWVYDNTYRNATRARTKSGGVSIEGAYGGVPFPIPSNGHEAMWNHVLAWRGESIAYEGASHVIAGRTRTLSSVNIIEFQYPYYYRDVAPDRFNGIYQFGKVATVAPPLRAGERIVGREPVDQYAEGRRTWVYLVGQRRVRRAPNAGYDTPNFVASGFGLLDEGYLFNGALDRYDWKLVGKREMLVPYNTHAFHLQPAQQVLGAQHVNPDHLRWELHRVWIVEATLAPGKRHIMPRRRFYLDEDTWQALLADGWDANGQLWHVSHALPTMVPELPAVVVTPYVLYDLLRNGYVASSLFNEGQRHYQVTPRKPEDYFSPAALVAEGIR